MRIYIIGNDGIALSREAPAALDEREIVALRMRNCMPPCSVASSYWHCGTLCRASPNARRSATVQR